MYAEVFAGEKQFQLRLSLLMRVTH